MDCLRRNPGGTPVGYPCCHRRFPNPDPKLRYLDFEEGPSDFWTLPYDERSRRLRAYLLAIASGADPLLGWMVALDFTPETIRAIHFLIDVENRDDRRLLDLIQRGAHPPDRIVRFTPDGWRPG